MTAKIIAIANQKGVEQMPQKKRREWERLHRGRSWYIPPALHAQAMEVRAEILWLAQKHLATASNVADVLIAYSLAQVQSGRLTLHLQAKKKTILAWEEANSGQKQEIPRPAVAPRQQATRLTYRIRDNTVRQLTTLGLGVANGEAVLLLLRHALEAYKSGRMRLRVSAVAVQQIVVATDYGGSKR